MILPDKLNNFFIISNPLQRSLLRTIKQYYLCYGNNASVIFQIVLYKDLKL